MPECLLSGRGLARAGHQVRRTVIPAGHVLLIERHIKSVRLAAAEVDVRGGDELTWPQSDGLNDERFAVRQDPEWIRVFHVVVPAAADNAGDGLVRADRAVATVGVDRDEGDRLLPAYHRQ